MMILDSCLPQHLSAHGTCVKWYMNVTINNNFIIVVVVCNFLFSREPEKYTFKSVLVVPSIKKPPVIKGHIYSVHSMVV